MCYSRALEGNPGMINGGYLETPDSWIERNEDDPNDRYYRGGGEREDVISCDTCEREMPVSSPTGNCFICDFEWMAQRQLTFPGNGRLSGGVRAELIGEVRNTDAASSLFTGETISHAQEFEHIDITDPRPASMSSAVAKQVKVSEGPETGGNKPLMRNRTGQIDASRDSQIADDASLQETSTREINGIVDVIKYFNRRFGINE